LDKGDLAEQGLLFAGGNVVEGEAAKSRELRQIGHWLCGILRKYSKRLTSLKKVWKKSDAQVGRVNTFHILQTIRKRPSTFRF
jgi:hypothetical protein